MEDGILEFIFFVIGQIISVVFQIVVGHLFSRYPIPTTIGFLVILALLIMSSL